MKKIIIILVLSLNIFSKTLIDNKSINNFTSIFKPLSQDYSFTTGLLFNDLGSINYSLFNANYISKINDNLFFNYGFGYLNYSTKNNALFTNFGLNYHNEKFSLNFEFYKTFNR